MDTEKEKISIKILTQGFYPDFVATGELMYELALKLVESNMFEVSIITTQPSFVKKESLPKRETINGIDINRLFSFKFDKNQLKGKVFNSFSFFFSVMHHLNFSKKVDWLLIPTSPPLLPLLGAYTKILKGQKYIFLMHDVYPEIAAKLGYIKKDGIIYKMWDILTGFALKKADKIIVLSDDMKDGLLKWLPVLDETQIDVIHNWANENLMKIIPTEENPFLDQFKLRDKFIVEYSGNIGQLHEFDTLLHSAKALQNEKDILFLFIGEGAKKHCIKEYIENNNLDNIMILPYQKREDLAYSLGMADIHVLSLQEQYNHLAAPSKLYGILASGKPVIFIGSQKCYIARILEKNHCGFQVDINDSEKLIHIIKEIKNNTGLFNELSQNSRKTFEENYTLKKATNNYYKFLYNKHFVDENQSVKTHIEQPDLSFTGVRKSNMP
jgi:glycosyltransferase involved in cell wall biosynthesis